MSEKSILERLQVKPGRSLRLINPPDGIASVLGPLPERSKMASKFDKADIVLFFVKNMEWLKTGLSAASDALTPGGILWVVYPKLTSVLRSDVSRDTIWKYAGTIGWTGVAMISVDETWSAFRMKRL
ncbi:MAG: hypothetical protein CVU42_08055 [Chloroflexi bacterium HGW-Chloroflexi-4]|jgi:hypothetical protein|nr:MAG: hypothetical protein CVU43_16090 [Chloroflexi bacterium HGW-Chloroflexi-5]PKN99441.1 MAG: hypothetical protein CVU42_08055 [Chloroflexi bacterium HGW-Chloroflexi-4]